MNNTLKEADILLFKVSELEAPTTFADMLRLAEVLAAVAQAEALTRIADAMEKEETADFTTELPF